MEMNSYNFPVEICHFIFTPSCCFSVYTQMVICIGLSKSALSTYITSKVPKMWYTLMDHYSFDIVANRLQLKTEEDLVALLLWFPIYMTSAGEAGLISL